MVGHWYITLFISQPVAVVGGGSYRVPVVPPRWVLDDDDLFVIARAALKVIGTS